jgi:3,4-dihydroxy 2-butanone 4-phosphate synthase/GTP cyclohydrolase II
VTPVDPSFATIDEAIEEIREGRMLIVVDDEDRENEGDFVMAADMVTPAAINFMITNGRGLVCAPLSAERIDALKLPTMTDTNTSEQGTAFHVSVGAKGRITTGISAADRAATVHALVDPATRPEDLSMPGHVFRSRPVPAGSWNAPGTPRPPPTSPGWRV